VELFQTRITLNQLRAELNLTPHERTSPNDLHKVVADLDNVMARIDRRLGQPRSRHNP
jgi:hypothetical protein